MVARLVLVLALSTLIPITYSLPSIQQASAFSTASDTTLPGGASKYCTTSTGFYEPVLQVPTNNSNKKLVIATLGGDTVVDGHTDDMDLELALPGGSFVDSAVLSDQYFDNVSLSYTGNPSGTYSVLFRSITGYGVCLTQNQSDLRVICTTTPNCDGS